MMSTTKFLVLIDCQNDFITGALGSEWADKTVPNIVERVKEGIANKEYIWATLDEHDAATYAETLEGKKLPVPHCIKGTAGAEIDPRIEKLFGVDRKEPKKTLVYKHTFGSLHMPEYFRRVQDELGVDVELEFVGFCTDICVVSNVLIARATLPNAKITVNAKCCAGTSVEAHNAALTVMRSCQIDIINDEVASNG